MDNIIIRENNHIKSIFKNHPKDENINLLKILTALRSKKYPNRQLFVSIEQEYDEGPVIFQYPSEMENEADGIIPVIPLYIKGLFGDMGNHWFKPSADIGIEGYEYLQEERRVVPSKSNVLANLDEDWDQSMMRYDDDSISDYDSDGDDDYGGFSIEFGDLKIGNNDVQANIDDSASTGTMNLPKPDGFIDSDSTSEPQNTRNKPKIVINLSNEFAEQEPSPSEELKKFSKINLVDNGKDRPKDMDSPETHDKQNMSKDTSTIILSDSENNEMETSSTDNDDDSSMISTNNNDTENESHNDKAKELENDTTTTTQDSDNNLGNTQIIAPKPLGETSLKIINSSVYAPSKQDGGGKVP